MSSVQEAAYKSSRKYRCPYCDIRATRQDLIKHVNRQHKDMLPEDYTADRAIYDSINGKNYNTCMICKDKVYDWDDKHGRYRNLCNKKSCREAVRKTALERHIKVYNRPTLLDIPEWQAEHMLSKRKISGTYKFTDGGTVGYTGSYEKKCLEFLDVVMGYKSDEIQSPGPTLYYDYKGDRHFYISDFFIIPANLIIEVKDGGSNPNTRNMPEYRGKQYAKEKMITELGNYNYVRLTDNNFSQLLDILADIKYDMIEERPVKIRINEVGLAGSPAVSALPNQNDQSVYIVPRMLSNTFTDTDNNEDIEFFLQSDSLGESFIGQGDDNRLYLYTKEDIGDQPYAFKYIGEDAVNKLNIIKRLFKESKPLRDNVIVEVFMGHKPMVMDEILCNESFSLEENPWKDRREEYRAIAEQIYSEANINKNIMNSIKATMDKLKSMTEALKEDRL